MALLERSNYCLAILARSRSALPSYTSCILGIFWSCLSNGIWAGWSLPYGLERSISQNAFVHNLEILCKKSCQLDQILDKGKRTIPVISKSVTQYTYVYKVLLSSIFFLTIHTSFIIEHNNPINTQISKMHFQATALCVALLTFSTAALPSAEGPCRVAPYTVVCTTGWKYLCCKPSERESQSMSHLSKTYPNDIHRG